MAATRRLLSALPAVKRSVEAPSQVLALVTSLSSWLGSQLDCEHRARAPNSTSRPLPSYSFETTETLLREFDTNVRARGRLWQGLRTRTTLCPGPSSTAIGSSSPRRAGTVVRNHINHLIHHRGQLTVYLRLNDVPCLRSYGPTADEGRM